MYSSFFFGSYGLKFLNGESTAAATGFFAGDTASDLVFIGVFVDSLDFVTGDFVLVADLVG
jgi:hypothetical protein